MKFLEPCDIFVAFFFCFHGGLQLFFYSAVAFDVPQSRVAGGVYYISIYENYRNASSEFD